MTESPVENLDRHQRDRWSAFCQAAQAARASFNEDAQSAKALFRAFGFSDFVADGCIGHPEMASELIRSGDLVSRYDTDHFQKCLSRRLESLITDRPDAPVADLIPPLQATLRSFRRREMVRIAVRDLAGLSDLDETMADLSALASAAIDDALALLYQQMTRTEGTPADAAGNEQKLVVIGMGKLGAGELNFSSDVDLIFAFPAVGETRGGKAPCSNQDFFSRLCRTLIQAIGENTDDGFVFRMDTRLRPYGDGGPLVMSFDQMEDYYQSQGREWERYALVKADVVAGDRDAGRILLYRLRPFVYRRYLDFGVFESLREMKRKINAEVRRKKLHDNIKLGRGGIREIEFFGQMFQLIRGGVLPSLQNPAIQPVLAVLEKEGIVPVPVCRELTSAYRFLRMVEHRLQEANDQQTHALPSQPVDMLRLARSMGFTAQEEFEKILTDHRGRVRSHFDGLLATAETDAVSDQGESCDISLLVDAWNLSVSTEERRKLLAAAGFKDAATAVDLLEKFKTEPATRSLSSTGKGRLDRLMPRVLQAIGSCEAPETVLGRVLDLLKQIQQRTSYLSLLVEYPNALVHLIRLVSASPWIAAFLRRHPVLLDELLDPRSLYKPPGREALRSGLERHLSAVADDDPEYQIESLCIFRQVNTLRVAASDITSVLPLMKVSDHLSWIAETILDKVVQISWNHLEKRHGRPSCSFKGKACEKGFAVIGYGKLGGIELGYASDLDLVFLHAADPGETVGGKQSIDNSHFFARLGQRVVHMLTTHTAAGALYETDMRLRPSGSSGLLVSHVDGFETYQLKEAWTWEHQALIRARPIVGDVALMDAFRAIRKKVLCLRRETVPLKKEVVEMRERMRESRLAGDRDRFDIKEDPGAIVDIEFLVQYLVLRFAHRYPETTRWTDNVRILQSLAEAGVIDEVTAYRLRRAYLIFRAAAHRLNLAERSTRVDGRRFAHLAVGVRRVWKRILL